MNRFLLQAAIIIGAGLVTGLTFALTSPVQLRVPEDINKGLHSRPPAPPTGATGAAVSTGTQGSTGSTGATAPPPTGPTGAAPTAELEISVATAKQIFDSQQAVFIDARSLEKYLKGHINNAMHLEKDALNGPPPAKALGYLPGMTVVVYCDGEMCTDSHNVVKRLHALNKGIGPFHVIKDGFPGWEKAGHPIVAGPEVGFE